MALTNIANKQRLKLKGYKTNKAPVMPSMANSEITQCTPESITGTLIKMFNLEPAGFNSDCFTDEEKYLLDERAAIYEYDGGLSREDAESRAITEIIIKQNYKDEHDKRNFRG